MLKLYFLQKIVGLCHKAFFSSSYTDDLEDEFVDLQTGQYLDVNTEPAKENIPIEQSETCILCGSINSFVHVHPEQQLNKSINMEKEYATIPALFFDILKINLTKDDTMIIYYDTDFQDQRTKYQIINLDHHFCVLFSTDKIIDEIYCTYTLDGDVKQNILDQVDLDFFRMDINFNSVKCQTVANFKNCIDKFKKYSYGDNNLYNLILMLSTQSSFYYPFAILNDVYTEVKSGMYVMTATDFPYINIIDKKTSVDIIFKKTFKHINVETKEISNRFHTFMVLTIDLINMPDGYIFCGDRYCQTEIGMIYWIKEKN